MKSFKDYAKQAPKVCTEEEQTASAFAQKIAQAYHGKNTTEILKSILAEAEKSKRAGTLSNEEIEDFYQSFAPMLNAAKQKQLRMVVERLKKIE